MSAFEAEDSDIAIRTGRFQTPFTVRLLLQTIDSFSSLLSPPDSFCCCLPFVVQLAEELLPVESHEASFQLVTPRMWSRVPAGSRQEPDTVEEVASRRPIASTCKGEMSSHELLHA